MILIYAYINKFKNYTTQEIIFDPRWQINFSNEKLSIQYRGQSSASAVIRGDRKPDNLHILVGKTGSGKTNLLQMIGAKHDVRYHRKWEGEDDSYFLLYSISDTEFFLEICDMEIMQFPKPVERDDSTIPEPIRENARRAGTLRTVRFALEKALKPGETAVRFCAVKEYGYERNLSELKVRDMAMIMNCYDVHAFIRPPYPDDAGIFTECLLPYEFTRLSTGEYQYAKVLGGMEDYLKLSSSGRTNRGLDKIILMDEPEAYMHPELARQFIARMLKIVEKYQGPSTIQIILSTHSPFMLSDVLPEEITRLTIDRETGNALVKNGSDKEYFGANIHTILADGFFLDYTIGEYSRSFLQNAFSRLERYADHGDADESFLMSMEQLIPHIGDRMIRRAFELQMEKVRKHD